MASSRLGIGIETVKQMIKIFFFIFLPNHCSPSAPV